MLSFSGLLDYVFICMLHPAALHHIHYDESSSATSEERSDKRTYQICLSSDYIWLLMQHSNNGNESLRQRVCVGVCVHVRMCWYACARAAVCSLTYPATSYTCITPAPAWCNPQCLGHGVSAVGLSRDLEASSGLHKTAAGDQTHDTHTAAFS